MCYKAGNNTNVTEKLYIDYYIYRRTLASSSLKYDKQ